MPRCIALTACLLLLGFGLAGCKRHPAASSSLSADAPPGLSDEFLSLMNAGRNYLEQGDATNALALYAKARAIAPNNAEVRLNLANAHLLAGTAEEAIREAAEALKLRVYGYSMLISASEETWLTLAGMAISGSASTRTETS